MHKIAKPKFSEDIFRAYDVRGIYPDEINEDAAYRIARAFAGYVRLGARSNELEIVVSSDARVSSPALKDAFIRGLIDEGGHIVDAGHTTTPMHYFIVNKTGAAGGAMITASHNPAQFNGIKLTREKATVVSVGAGMEEVKNTALRGIFSSPTGELEGITQQKNFLDDYVLFFEERFSALKGFERSFVSDAGNGMTGIILKKLFTRFGFKHMVIHDELDMTFPHHEADPSVEKNMEDVKRMVREKGFNFGVSFDGDGDRIGFVDELGNMVRADHVAALLGSSFAGEAVVTCLGMSKIVGEAVLGAGGRIVETKVGHPSIKHAMQKEKAAFGAEVSGHFYFRDFFGVDSGLFAFFSVLEILKKQGKPLSELVRPFQKYAKTGELNFVVADKEAVIDQMIAHFPDAEISYLDGAKVMYPSWWFLIRQSNTENLVRLIIEADSKELLEEKKKYLIAILNTMNSNSRE